MLREYEENQILKGISEIIFNLDNIPTEDVAYFLVKFNPHLAEELVASLQYEIFDNREGSKHE